jgi:hypothetical protein
VAHATPVAATPFVQPLHLFSSKQVLTSSSESLLHATAAHGDSAALVLKLRPAMTSDAIVEHFACASKHVATSTDVGMDTSQVNDAQCK